MMFVGPVADRLLPGAGRIDNALHEQRFDSTAKTNPTVQQDDRDRFSKLSRQLRIVGDIDGCDGWQRILKTDQHGHRVVAQSASRSSQQFAGSEEWRC